MRKFRSLFLASLVLCILCAILPLQAHAAEVIDSGSCGDGIKWVLTEDGTLTISGQGEMENFSHEDLQPWCDYREQILTVVVGEGITSVGNHAFTFLASATRISLPGGLQRIGDYALYSMESLTQIHLPSSLSQIGQSALSWCVSLTSVELPSGLNAVSDSLFYQCVALEQVSLPASLESIEGCAFGYCESLTQVYIPEGTAQIGSGAFMYCSNLTDVMVPASVTTIGASAFSRCDILTIHGYLGSRAHYYARQYDITFAPLNDWADSGFSGSCGDNLTWALTEDGTLTISGTGAITSTPWEQYFELVVSLVVEEGVTSLCNSAFRGFVALEQVALPQSLTIIGDYAFADCTELVELVIPDGVTSIGAYAFSSCTALQQITLPKNLTGISTCLFYDCTVLSWPVIPEGVTEISKYAFEECKNLGDVVIPASVTTIGSRAFYNCDGMSSIRILGNVTEIPDAMCAYCDQLTFVELPDSVTTIGRSAFTYGRMKSIDLPANLTVIKDHAFSDCALTELTLPDHVTEIGAYAFEVTKLTSLVIPGQVELIDEGAFYACDSLVVVSISQGVRTITEKAFGSCDSLCKVFIPGSVEIISSNCFAYSDKVQLQGYIGTPVQTYAAYYDIPFLALDSAVCSDPEFTVSGTCGENLTWTFSRGTLTVSGSGAMLEGDQESWKPYRELITALVVEEGVTAISSQAFAYLYNLTTVSLPDSITSMGSYAFAFCINLEKIDLPDRVAEIEEGMFRLCVALAQVDLPAALNYIGEDAFYRCSALTRVEIPDGTTAIGDYAFCSCTSLKEVVIPASITEIGDYYGYSVFDYCPDLTILGYTGSEAESYAQWEQFPFQALDSGLSGTFGDNLTWTLFNRTLTVSGTGPIPDFGEYYETFILWDPAPWEDYADLIHTIIVSDGVTAIGNYAFYSCGSIRELILPDSLTRIGDRAFSGCNLMTELVIPDSVTQIGADTFSYWTALEKLTLPSKLISIGDEAFDSCYMLSDIRLPAGLQTIGKYAFYMCPLTELTIPASVTQIGETAFLFCDDLTIQGYAGSYAETFAKEQGIPFRAIAGHSHSYSATQIPPTCTSQGYVYHLCDCGSSYTDSYVPAAEHSWDADRICTVCGAQENPFSDVQNSDYFFTPVLWAVDKGITAGTGNGQFSPNNPCTRGQVVTFLWRAAGQPEPTSTENPFTDVTPADYFYKPVLWAVENGITAGLNATTFGPNATCTRGQVVTFLWRAKGKPEAANPQNDFTDVTAADYFYAPVLWAVENGITAGMGGGKFAPNNPCTRGQVVTFLYRAFSDQ